MPSELADLESCQLAAAVVMGRIGTPATATVSKGAIGTFCTTFKNKTGEYRESNHRLKYDTGQPNAGGCAEVIT